MNCSIPAACASSTAYWISGLSTTGSISLGIALVAGRKRTPSPPTGNMALRTARTIVAPPFFERAVPAPSGRLQGRPCATARRGLQRPGRLDSTRMGAALARPTVSPSAEQQVLGLIDLGCEVGRAAMVGMVLLHEAAVGLLDLLAASPGRKPEDFVGLL